MMTPDQRYFFDLTGYLHLRNVLSPEELAPAQAAADRYINMPPEEWPPEFGADLERRDLTGYQHGFAFDKSLEVLTRHPATWPILMELTDRRPRLNGGTLGYNRHGHGFHYLHAGWRPAKQPDVRRYYIQDGLVRCTDFIFFFYLSDVFPGDGGLIVLPGSHKAHFDRPRGMFYLGSEDDEDRDLRRPHRASGRPQCLRSRRRCGHHARAPHARRAHLETPRPRPPLPHLALQRPAHAHRPAPPFSRRHSPAARPRDD